jgi:tetratricopeptide (TPR) repeat protein
VRGVVWSGLTGDTRNGVFTSLQAHFEAVPKIADWHQVNSLEDLTPAIELYNSLIGLERYDDALHVFSARINKAMRYRLGSSRQRIELLEMLFPFGLNRLPLLSKRRVQSFVLNSVANAYQLSGQPQQAVPLFHRSIELYTQAGISDIHSTGYAQSVLSRGLRFLGLLRESELTITHSLAYARQAGSYYLEAIYLCYLGLTLATRGAIKESRSTLQRSFRLNPRIGSNISFLAQLSLWLGEFDNALQLADRAWNLANTVRHEADSIIAARLQGAAALGLDNIAKADELLHHALTRARAVNLVEEELPALVALAELRRRQKDLKAARELLDDVWEYAERGPYPLFHTDAFNVLAQIERDAGNNAAAVDAATKAYRLAWCDGEPYAYHWGLVAARKHLRELGAPEPPMPPFDESKYEPMPEVEINLRDEFYVETDDNPKDERSA